MAADYDKDVISCIQAKSHEEYRLTIADFVAGALGFEAEFGDDLFSRPLKTNVISTRSEGGRRERKKRLP